MIELQFFILGGRTQDTLTNLNRVNRGCCPFIGSTETSTCLRFFVNVEEALSRNFNEFVKASRVGKTFQ